MNPVPVAVPAVGPPRRPRLPVVAERTFGNGLRVLAVRKPGIPMVQARLSLPTGRRGGPLASDNARQRVLAGALLSAGTDRRSSAALAEAIGRLGATLDASVDSEDLRLRGATLAPSLADYLALMSEVLTEPGFHRAEVEVERARKRQEVLLTRANPAALAGLALARRAFPTHPYGMGLPDPDEVAAVNPGELRRYLRGRVGPAGGTLVLVGDLRPERALDTAEAALGGWGTAKAGVSLPRPEPVAPGPTLLVDRPGAVQSNIRMAALAPTRADATLAPFQLANMVFGGYFSSRLVENIREHKGYTYSPRSVIDHQPAASLLSVSADVATDVTGPALLEIRYELGRMATLAVSQDELDAARRYLIGTTALGIQTQAGLANYLFILSLTGLSFEYLRTLPDRLAAVTVDDVLESAAAGLAPTRLVTVILGDADRVRDAVATLVEVDDAQVP